MKRILVSGGRMFDRFQALYDQLDKEAAGHVEIVLRHGRCNPRRANGAVVPWDLALTYPPRIQRALLGADWHAYLHAVERGWAVEERPAGWDRHGKAAGGIRNQEMVDEQPTCDVLVAAPDPNSSGTYDCARRAEAAGIPVEWVP